MNVSLGKYRNNKKVVEAYLNKNKFNLEDAVSTLAVATHVPVIVIAYYIGEIIGFTPEVLKKINSLKKFYNYGEIVE